MRLLAFDSSVTGCRAAAMAAQSAGGEPRVLAAGEDATAMGQAAALVPLLSKVVAEAGWRFDDLARIAVTVGPGSFAGVRIGLATAEGLALALGCPLVGVGTLPALAASAAVSGGESLVLSVVDSRRGDVFAGLYAVTEGGTVAHERAAPVGIAPDALPGLIRASAGTAPVTVVGDAAEPVAAALRAAGIVVAGVEPRPGPDAAAVGRLAWRLPEPRERPRPLYLRPPDVSLPAADRHADVVGRSRGGGA